MLLREVRFDVIKGNISEIAYLAEGIGTTKGVDANLDALSTEGNLRWHTDLARKVVPRLARPSYQRSYRYCRGQP